MNRRLGLALMIVAVVGVIVVYAAMFSVHQAQNAVVIRFGRLIETVKDSPGLHWRIPFIDDVVYIDSRLINIDAPSVELTTQDQKRVVISAYLRYRITDPETFYRVARMEQAAERRLIAVLNQMMRDVFGSVPMQDVLTEKRAALMTTVTKRLEPTGDQFGVEVVDVRFKRVDLPSANSEAIYNRMRTQRAQEAAQFRAEGEAEARSKRADADKQRIEVLAEARKKAQVLRGEGDARATQIYNEAFGRDPEFFDFYRSLQAMRTGLSGETTTFVGEPKGDFFRFFEQGDGIPAQPQQ